MTTPGSLDFVLPNERIAVFDNDGTLWCEKPMYIQLAYLLGKLTVQAEQDDSLSPADMFLEWVLNRAGKNPLSSPAKNTSCAGMGWACQNCALRFKKNDKYCFVCDPHLQGFYLGLHPALAWPAHSL